MLMCQQVQFPNWQEWWNKVNFNMSPRGSSWLKGLIGQGC